MSWLKLHSAKCPGKAPSNCPYFWVHKWSIHCSDLSSSTSHPNPQGWEAEPGWHRGVSLKPWTSPRSWLRAECSSHCTRPRLWQLGYMCPGFVLRGDASHNALFTLNPHPSGPCAVLEGPKATGWNKTEVCIVHLLSGLEGRQLAMGEGVVSKIFVRLLF